MPQGHQPGTPKTGGRHKGVPNKNTTALKEKILAALDEVGGAAYLVKVAKTDPRSFCALLGKVLPMQMVGDPNAPLELIVTWQTALADKSE